MGGPRSIAVAVDGSEAAKRATLWAASLLRHQESLHIVTVRGTSAKEASDAATLLRDQAAAVQRAGVPLDRLVTLSLPAPGLTPGGAGAALTEYAATDDVKLLVVGSRGMGAVRGALMSMIGLGSVSSFLLEHAQLPIGIAHGNFGLVHDGDAVVKAPPTRRICVAVDGSDGAVQALLWTLDGLVDRSRDTLHLVTVTCNLSKPRMGALFAEATREYSRGDEGTAEHSGHAAEDAATAVVKQAAASALKAGLPKEQIECAVLPPASNGGAGEGGALVKYAKSQQMDMMVLGHRGAGAYESVVMSLAGLGSVTRHCVQHATCPVIAVRLPRSRRALGLKRK